MNAIPEHFRAVPLVRPPGLPRNPGNNRQIIRPLSYAWDNLMIPYTMPRHKTLFIREHLRGRPQTGRDLEGVSTLLVPYPGTDTVNQHECCAFLRRAAEAFILRDMRRLREQDGRPLHTRRILDVGGNSARMLEATQHMDLTYHACCPILDSHDYARRAQGNHRRACTHSCSECTCIDFTVSMSVDSLYYLTNDDLQHLCSGGRSHYAALHVFDSRAGHVPSRDVQEGTYSVTNGFVSMHVLGDPKVYHHPDASERLTRCDLLSNGQYLCCTSTQFAVGTYRVVRFFISPVPSVAQLAPRVQRDPLINQLVASCISHKRFTRQDIGVGIANQLPANLSDRLVDLIDPVYEGVQTFLERLEPKPTAASFIRKHAGHIVAAIAGIVGLSGPAFWKQLTHAISSVIGMVLGLVVKNKARGLELNLRSFSALVLLATLYKMYRASSPAQRTAVATTVTYARHTVFGRARQLAVKVGTLCVKAYGFYKPGVGYHSLFRWGSYVPPRPAKDVDSVIESIHRRISTGPEQAPEGWPRAADFNGWDIGNNPDDTEIENGALRRLAFNDWVTRIYGRRNNPNLVKEYSDAYTRRVRADFVPRPELRVTFNVKDECYPGKSFDVKPRGVFDVVDKTQTVLPALFSSTVSHFLGRRGPDGLGHASGITYTGGMTPAEIGLWFDRAKAIFPCAIEGDYASFESRVNVDLLEKEFQWYERLGADEQTASDFRIQKKVTYQFYRSGAKLVYTRVGGRCSGVPNTSVGNSYVNALVIHTTMLAGGFRPRVDYVALVLGDDNLIMATPAAYEYYKANCVRAAAQFGMILEPVFHPQERLMEASFCSMRFVYDTSGRCTLQPKLGRLLLKTGQVPEEITDYVKYLAPTMAMYARSSPCPLTKAWATKWCATTGTSVDMDPAAWPPFNHHHGYALHLDEWQEFIQRHPPTPDGRWFLPNDAVVNAIIERDCPVEWPLNRNGYAVSEAFAPPGKVQRWYHFLFRKKPVPRDYAEYFLHLTNGSGHA